jgi:hypothetical protein
MIIEGPTRAESSATSSEHLTTKELLQITAVLRQFSELKWGANWIKIEISKPGRLDSGTWLDMAKYIFVWSTIVQDVFRKQMGSTIVSGEELWVACRASAPACELVIVKVIPLLCTIA